MSAPESLYRHPARPRPTTDIVTKVCSLLCDALVVVGAGVAAYGTYEAERGGGDGSLVVALVGVAFLMGGAGGGVLLATGRR